ncbi:MAG: type IV toxin-antitoxin system AbiEi family antitoxin domain-containing protein [Desertimonas sp.]
MRASRIEEALSAALRDRHGVVTTAMLAELGATRTMVATLTRSGRLRRICRGVFVAASAPRTPERRLALACAATAGVVCFPTAGRVWQLRGTPHHDVVHVVVPWERRPAVPPWVTVHRSTHLPECDIVRRADGIDVTTPPRTVFDAAAWLRPERLESMIEQGIDREMFAVPTLIGVQRRLRRCGRDGSGRFAAVVAAREPWRKAVESHDELRLERAMRRRGFPPLVRGHPLHLPRGGVIHPDLGLPDDRFFVEVDHHTWHGGRSDASYDKWRDRQVRLAGCHVERVSDLAIEHDLAATVDELWQRWQQVRGVKARFGE